LKAPVEPPISAQSSLSNVSRTTLIAFVALAIGISFLAFRMVVAFILPVLIGGILSLMLRQPYRFVSRSGKRSKKAAFVVTLGLVLVILLPLGLFATLGIRQGIAVGRGLSETGISYQALTDKISQWEFPHAFGFEPKEVELKLQEWARSLGAVFLATVLAIGAHIPAIFFQLVLMALSCFFFLIDGDAFVAWTKDKIPLDQAVRSRLSKSFQDTSVSVIWATLAASGAQAITMLVLFKILGIPAIILAAGATFLFAWIPMVGSSPVWLLGVLYLFLNGATGKVAILTVAGLSIGLLDNFVRAYVLKGRSEMHPLVSLIAIFGGIEMFGIMGVFLGPIIAAIFISVLEVWPGLGRHLGLLEDRKAIRLEKK